MAQDGIQLITQIAISSHSPVTGKAIADQYRKLFPGYQEKLPIEAIEPQAPGAPIRIVLGANGEAGIDVMMMPTPIPPDMLTFAYAMNPHWPEARAELQRCRSHVAVIALQRQDGRDNPIRNAICLTLISACLCNLLPAVGMFCPSGNALTPVRRLRELAAKMLSGEPPVEAWVQTIIADAPADKGQRRLTAMTNGLRMLVGREIEIRPVARDREKLLDVVHQLLRFTLQRGAGFNENDSVDLEDGDVARVRYASEGQRQEIPIFEIGLVTPDAEGKLPRDILDEKPSATAPSEKPGGSAPEEFMAVIALARPVQISTQMLAAAVKRRFPGFKATLAAVRDDDPESLRHNSYIIAVGKCLLLMKLIEAPIEPGRLDSAISAAQVTWRDASTKLDAHRAHIIIAQVHTSEGAPNLVGQAGNVSVVAAGLCDIAPALGVYWRSGNVVTRPEHFQELALAFTKGKIPVENWLQMRFTRESTENGKLRIGMITTGLMPFVGREIEFPPADLHPTIVGEQVYNTAQYLLANGPVIEHDHTIGISNAEAIRVRHLDRGRFTPRPVFELTLESLDSSQSPNEPPSYLRAVPEPEATSPPKAPPDNAASRMVRNLRRPQS